MRRPIGYCSRYKELTDLIRSTSFFGNSSVYIEFDWKEQFSINFALNRYACNKTDLCVCVCVCGEREERGERGWRVLW